jgi:hypothetical protein
MTAWMTGLASGALLYGLAVVLGMTGVGSLEFPGDVSVRAESTRSGRIYGRGGLRGGK